ncbi:MAG: hypothetical protein ABIH63_03125 [archaeon]
MKFVALNLKDKKLKWALVGTSNLALQGIDVKPNDLDIVTSVKNLDFFGKTFKRYVKEPIFKVPAYEGFLEYFKVRFQIKGVEVEVSGEYDNDVYFRRIKGGDLVKIRLGKIIIPCLSLGAQLEVYSELGKKDKIKLMREFFKK